MSWKPLNPQTAGFLGLLGLKNLGRNPDALLEEVRPTMNMEPWYLRAASLMTIRQSAALAVDYTGFFAPTLDQFAANIGAITVPEGEVWYIHECQSLVGATSIDLLTLHGCASAAMVPMGGGYVHYIMGLLAETSGAPSVSTALTFAAGRLWDCWAPAGTQFGIWIGDTTAQDGGVDEGVSVSTTVRYTPIRV